MFVLLTLGISSSSLKNRSFYSMSIIYSFCYSQLLNLEEVLVLFFFLWWAKVQYFWVWTLTHFRKNREYKYFTGTKLHSTLSSTSHLSCAEDHTTGPSIPSVASPVLSEGEGWPPLTCDLLPILELSRIPSAFSLAKAYSCLINSLVSIRTCKSALQLAGPQHMLVHGAVTTQVQDCVQ